MNSILELFKQDFSSLILGIFVIMSGIIAIYEIICKFSSIIGKPIGIMKQRKSDHELLVKTVQDLINLTTTVDDIANKIEVMQSKIDHTEMSKLKGKILSYYRKYKDVGEWEQFEADVFWGLYDSYISHGGNSFVRDTIEPVMRELKVKE